MMENVIFKSSFRVFDPFKSNMTQYLMANLFIIYLILFEKGSIVSSNRVSNTLVVKAPKHLMGIATKILAFDGIFLSLKESDCTQIKGVH